MTDVERLIEIEARCKAHADDLFRELTRLMAKRDDAQFDWQWARMMRRAAEHEAIAEAEKQ